MQIETTHVLKSVTSPEFWEPPPPPPLFPTFGASPVHCKGGALKRTQFRLLQKVPQPGGLSTRLLGLLSSGRDLLRLRTRIFPLEHHP